MQGPWVKLPHGPFSFHRRLGGISWRPASVQVGRLRSMRKTLVVAPLALIAMLLGIPRAASAKGPTVRIVISGDGLASPIEVTDQRILDSSNVWMGNFLDASHGTVKEPPAGLPRYEVSFYVKLGDNNVRKKYVAYYYPNPSAGQGYIYCPVEERPGIRSMWAPLSGMGEMESGTMPRPRGRT